MYRRVEVQIQSQYYIEETGQPHTQFSFPLQKDLLYPLSNWPVTQEPVWKLQRGENLSVLSAIKLQLLAIQHTIRDLQASNYISVCLKTIIRNGYCLFY
jgi:hypothetical protein